MTSPIPTSDVCRSRQCIVAQRNTGADRGVALVVNAFERNIEKVLRLGFFPGIERQNRCHFAERTLLINNVMDPARARDRAVRIFDSGEISSVHFVDSHIDNVLATLGLSKGEFGRLLHHSDCALVAPFITSSSYLLYWDADILLDCPVDWVEGAIDLLESQPSIFCVTPRPCWWDSSRELTVSNRSGFALGYGFSDQIFLVRTDELRQPIYRESCPASARYPASHVAATFEQRLDSYMRRNHRLRAVFLNSVFDHQGRSWYWPRNIPEAVRFIGKRFTSRALKSWPFGCNPEWRI